MDMLGDSQFSLSRDENSGRHIMRIRRPPSSRPFYSPPPARYRSTPTTGIVCLAVIAIAVFLLTITLHLVDAPSPANTALPVTELASHSPMPDGCQEANGCMEELVAPGGWTFTVFGNFPMSGSSAVTNAVIVVHGTGRNARGYFASMMAAAAKSGVAGHTIVIAPWFKTSKDSPGHGEATWSSAAWKIGEGAQSPPGLSSFLVMDEILATLASRQRFPDLRNITLTGHSAGGQFTQRYATFGLAPNVLPGVTIRYVPANPSSYVYFTSARPSGVSRSSCADYDTYKYGMQGRSGYPSQLTPRQALANYAHRDVTIVNGGADTFNNGDLDTNCAAMLQGPNRATRGANFLQYIHTIAPATNSRQTRIVVNGVDHDGDAIFNDPAVRAALFDPGATAGIPRTTPDSSVNSSRTSPGGD